MSGRHPIFAGNKVRAVLKTLRSEFQTHEAELHLTPRTDDVLAAGFVVLHLLSTGGTGPDGGDLADPLHLGESDGPAVLQKNQVVVDAAVVVTAVVARRCALPRLQTLPAELRRLLVRLTDGALHA